VAVLVTVLANGVVGGIAVRRDLHPFLVQSHFLLAMVSIAFGLVAIRRSRPEPVRADATGGVSSLGQSLGAAWGLLVAASLVTGTIVTGAGPHAGDESARRYGFDISTVAQIHSVTVWFAVAAFLVLVVAMRRDRHVFERMSSNVSTWMFLAVLQGGIGYLQYFNDVPAVLAGAHVAGATALWVVTVQFVHALFEPLSSDEHSVHATETSGEPRISFEAAPTA
jgi:cytochrome c oxidase assembly protein subunit 15